MRRALLLSAAAAAALSLAACNKENSGNTYAATTGNAAMGNVAVMGNAATVPGAPAPGPVNAATFVDNVGQSNMYEIQAAQIAEKNAKSPDVKAFARQMVTDHTKLQNELKQAAGTANQPMPTSLDARHQGLIDNLKSTSSADFDRTYIDQQVAAHQEALGLISGYAQNGDNATLKTTAQKAQPIIQSHLDKAQALQAKLGPTGAAAPGNAAAQ